MKFATPIASPRSQRRGFTLVEIMVVIAIIALLAAIAIPTILMSRANARGAAFINDLRQSRAIFEAFALENGTYPDDATPGEIPNPMTSELVKVHWTGPTPIGGQWDWDYQQFGFVAGVSVYRPSATTDEMRMIDERIDDGNLSTGSFRARAGGYIYIIE
jgi:type IV pilus assembly protein PilA